MNVKVFKIFLFCWYSLTLLSQDSLVMQLDTFPIDNQSAISADTLTVDAFNGIVYSKDSLDAPVAYKAQDSMIYDIANSKIHLYGNAEVTYTDISLKAGYIVLNWEESIVTAQSAADSLINKEQLPVFKQGSQEFTAHRLRYNFQTQKGIVYDVRTTYDQLYVLGSRTKFLSGQGDTTKNDILYNEDAVFTTCDHDVPHFGFRSKQQKVVPDKVAVARSARLEIGGVPTPIWIPFGFFPIKDNTKERGEPGLIFSLDYEYSEQWGFGLRNIGYYTPINDYMNLTLTGDIYLKGTYTIRADMDFKRRYRYNGGLNLSFSSLLRESEGLVTRSPGFQIRGSLTQDSKANPYIRWGGTINIQGNNYQSTIQNDARSVLQNTLTSNFNLQFPAPNMPFDFSVAFNHSQNTATRQVTIGLPTVSFQTESLYPFKLKERVGSERWYEKVVFRHSANFQNRFIATDTTLLTNQTWQDRQSGMKQTASLNTSFKLLKYFNLNPSISYNGVVHFKALNKTFNTDDDNVIVAVDTVYNADSTAFEIIRDTTQYGVVEDNYNSAFKFVNQMSSSLSLQTQLFATMQLKKGWLRGVRQVIKPSISLNYTPNFTNPDLFYDTLLVQTGTNTFSELDYGIYDDNIYSTSFSGTGEQMNVSYSFTNILEAKVFSKKDSTEKNIKLLDNIYVNGSYNLFRDSLKWSNLSMSGNGRFLKQKIQLNFAASFSPYASITSSSGSESAYDRFYWQENKGKFLRFNGATARVGTNFTLKEIINIFNRKPSESQEGEATGRRGEENRGLGSNNNRGQSILKPNEETLVSLVEGLRVSYNFGLSLQRLYGQDTLTITTHSLSFSGLNLKITDNWALNIGNIGYDFKSKGFSYPQLGLRRDLHCWEMQFNWAPTRNTYNFYLAVKPGQLDFLKLPYRRNNAEVFEGF